MVDNSKNTYLSYINRAHSMLQVFHKLFQYFRSNVYSIRQQVTQL